jgi:hypothetical protein
MQEAQPQAMVQSSDDFILIAPADLAQFGNGGGPIKHGQGLNDLPAAAQALEPPAHQLAHTSGNGQVGGHFGQVGQLIQHLDDKQGIAAGGLGQPRQGGRLRR